MKITYDQKSDAAYIYLIPAYDQREVVKTYLCDPYEAGTEINLDFDSSGILIGIEVLYASLHLHKDLLQTTNRNQETPL